MPNLDENEKNRLFMTLDAINKKQDEQSAAIARGEKKVDRLNLAVWGDKDLGIDGLQKDMKFVMGWITKMTMKVSFIAGGVSVAFFLVKALWEFILAKTGK